MKNYKSYIQIISNIISIHTLSKRFEWLLQIRIRHLVVFSLSLLPTLAFADGDTPVSQGLSYVINAIYGATGLSIATVAIIGVGLLCAGHYLEWKRLFQTVIGIGIMFGAGGVAAAIQALISR